MAAGVERDESARPRLAEVPAAARVAEALGRPAAADYAAAFPTTTRRRRPMSTSTLTPQLVHATQHGCHNKIPECALLCGRCAFARSRAASCDAANTPHLDRGAILRPMVLSSSPSEHHDLAATPCLEAMCAISPASRASEPVTSDLPSVYVCTAGVGGCSVREAASSCTPVPCTAPTAFSQAHVLRCLQPCMRVVVVVQKSRESSGPCGGISGARSLSAALYP